jgi:hypothetical protein
MKLFRFSKSQINQFVEDCSMRWYYRYALGIKTPPAGAMKLGLGYHETAAHNYKQKAKTLKDLPLDEMTDYFAESWTKGLESEEVVFEGDDTPDGLKDQGVGLVKALHKDIAPNVIPASEETVEQELHLLLYQPPRDHPTGTPEPRPQIFILPSDYRDAGREAESILEKNPHDWSYILDAIIDITDANQVIRENKTASKSPTQDDADKLLDLTTYALAHRLVHKKAETGVAMDVAVKTKQPKGVILASTRSRESLRAHLNRVGMMAKAIEQEIFIPHTNWYGCSAKWCGYWNRCPYGGKSRIVVDQGANLSQQLEASIEKVENG